MSYRTVTDRYYRWVRRSISVNADELRDKDKLMAMGEFPLLRGTFYRWAQQFPKRLPELAKAPTLLAVGDLHIENFGTWRDSDGRLAWGVNDFDDCAPMPYTVDLVRLATSAVVAIESGRAAAHEKLKTLIRAAICDAILEGYKTGREKPEAFVLAERNAWLRDLMLGVLTDRTRGETRYEHFYHSMADLKPLAGRVPLAAERLIRRSLPGKGVEIRIGHRVAGLGNLGRPRYTAIGDCWNGGIIVREAKPVVPSAWLWATSGEPLRTYYRRIVTSAVRSPDPWLVIGDDWFVRRIGPDTGRIELSEMPRTTGRELLHAMGSETANVHAGSRRALKAVGAHLATLPSGWLENAVHAMHDLLQADLAALRGQLGS